MKAKVLVLPILRRYWLFHAWKEVSASEKVTKSWRDAPSMQEKASLLLGNLQAKASNTAQHQWQKMEAAPEGSFNNRLFRLSQWALSQVEPSETFLKALPQQADSLQILYPASLPERLVRRRLRHLAAHAEPFHSSRLRVWSALLVPQIPLIPLPLPNVTIYYTLWRIISNRSAGRGAADLTAALQLFSDQQRLKLAQQLQQLQQQGVVLKTGSWAEQLASEAPRLEQQLQQTLSSIQQASNTSSNSSQQQQVVKRLPLPQFVADKQLQDLVRPADRLASPLPEAAVKKLEDLYKQDHLLEHYRAANRKCLGDKTQQKTQQQHEPQQQTQQQPQSPQQIRSQGSSSAPHLSQGGHKQQQQHRQQQSGTGGAGGLQESPARAAAAAAVASQPRQ